MHSSGLEKFPLGAAGTAVAPGDEWLPQMRIGMPQGTEAEERREGPGEKASAKEGERCRKKEESDFHLPPQQGSGTSFSYCDSFRCCSDGN